MNGGIRIVKAKRSTPEERVAAVDEAATFVKTTATLGRKKRSSKNAANGKPS